MTEFKSISDKRRRVNAIPFQGLWWSNTYDAVGVSLEDGVADGDLKDFADGNSALVRIAVPAKGSLVEARLSIDGVFPVSSPNSLRIYIAKFDTDKIGVVDQSESEKARQFEILTGNTTPLVYGSGEALFIDGLNLMPCIPKKGDTDYNEHGFVIGLELNIDSNSDDFVLNNFRIDCSISMGELNV